MVWITSRQLRMTRLTNIVTQAQNKNANYNDDLPPQLMLPPPPPIMNMINTVGNNTAVPNNTAACNLQDKTTLVQNKDYTHKFGVIYESTDSGVFIAIAPVEKSAIGDRVYASDVLIPEKFEKQSHLDWQTMIEDIKFRSNGFHPKMYYGTTRVSH